MPLDLTEQIHSQSVEAATLGIGILILLVLISSLIKHKGKLISLFLFSFITILVLGVSIYLVSLTIYLNSASLTKGPVHWHADFEVWKCGEKLNLEYPEGLSNKIGTSVLHEHNDERIHVEGVVMTDYGASLPKFFKVVGGDFNGEKLAFPTNEGLVILKNGDNCDGEKSSLQTFIFKTEGNIFYQQKLTDPLNYQMSQESTVPPGDCIIIELDKEKKKTDKLCQQYKIKVEQGELHGI